MLFRITASPDTGQLELRGDKSVSLSVQEEEGARLTVKPNVELRARSFTVTDTQGQEILSVAEDRVR